MAERIDPTTGFEINTGLAQLCVETEPLDDMGVYIADQAQRYVNLPAAQIINYSARLPEIADFVQKTSTLPARASGQAFKLGAILGLRALELSESSWVIPELDGKTVSFTLPASSTIQDETLVNWAQAVQAMGDTGYYELAIPVHARLDAWGLPVVHDTLAVPSFKRGFGFMLQAARKVVERQASVSFEHFMMDAELDLGEWAKLEADFESGGA